MPYESANCLLIYLRITLIEKVIVALLTVNIRDIFDNLSAAFIVILFNFKLLTYDNFAFSLKRIHQAFAFKTEILLGITLQNLIEND